MRASLALAALVLGARPGLSAQAGTPPPPQAQPSQPGRAPDTTQLSQIVAAQRAAGQTYLPDADRFTVGDRTIAPNVVVDGPVAVVKGNIDVYGTVNGDVVSLDGDIRVHRGARITGGTWAVAGKVVIDGGVVEGQRRVIAVVPPALPTLPASRSSAPMGTWESVKLVIGWFAILAIIGLGVMVFAEGNLDGVVLALERGFARSFWLGVAGQVLLLPGLVVLVTALAITILGVLLVPFAIVAYIVAAAGLVTLGFLAIARLTGDALASDRGTTSRRGVHLRGLVIGLVVYLGIWLLAAAFAWSPVLGALLRALAMAITWVAATVGLGATLASRAGTQRPGASTASKAVTDEFAWQTPTPVTGVAAAGRVPRVGAGRG